MDILKEFIKPELLILIPVLYLIGMGLKSSETVKDKYIPIILGATGCFLTILYVLGTSNIINYKDILMGVFMAVTQGILVAGASNYLNQIIKQSSKEE